jgi:hypothetical protein
VKCDGYASTTCNRGKGRPHFGSDAREASAADSTPPLAITAYAIPFQIPGCQKDRKLLHYFCVQASHDLSGYLSSEFWSRVVLRFSHTEPAVRHALVAVSSIHLEFVTHGSPDDRQSRRSGYDVEVLQQYNRAVRQLRSYLSGTAQPSIKVALICCALFYCFDSARGDYDSAREHLRSGLVMLQFAKTNGTDDKASPDSLDSRENLEQLTQTFARLDLQATMSDDTRVPFIELTSAEERCGARPVVPSTVFGNMEDARRTLDKLQNQLFNFLTRNNRHKFVPVGGLPDSLVLEKGELAKQFRRWSAALDGFLELQTQRTVDEGLHGNPELPMHIQRGATILKLHHRLGHMFLLAGFPEDPSVFGATPNPDVEFVLAMAESLVQSNHESNLYSPSTSPATSRSFSAEMGIVAPLFLLAMKCHDGYMRAKAVSLLAISNRREGLIDGRMVLGIVERVEMLKRKEETTPLVVEAARRLPTARAEEMPLEVWGADAIHGTKDGLQGIAKMLGVPC